MPRHTNVKFVQKQNLESPILAIAMTFSDPIKILVKHEKYFILLSEKLYSLLNNRQRHQDIFSLNIRTYLQFVN